MALHLCRGYIASVSLDTCNYQGPAGLELAREQADRQLPREYGALYLVAAGRRGVRAAQ